MGSHCSLEDNDLNVIDKQIPGEKIFNSKDIFDMINVLKSRFENGNVSADEYRKQNEELLSLIDDLSSKIDYSKNKQNGMSDKNSLVYAKDLVLRNMGHKCTSLLESYPSQLIWCENEKKCSRYFDN